MSFHDPDKPRGPTPSRFDPPIHTMWNEAFEMLLRSMSVPDVAKTLDQVADAIERIPAVDSAAHAATVRTVARSIRETHGRRTRPPDP